MRLSKLWYVLLVAVGCSAGGGGSKFAGSGGSGAGTGTGNDSGNGGSILGLDAGTGGNGSDSVVTPSCTANCSDFPSAPILDGNVPANAATLFGPAGMFSASLCVVEPQLSAGSQPGALFPANWARPRFRMSPANGENLFEIRIQAPSEAGELVAYTVNTVWQLPAAVWTKVWA